MSEPTTSDAAESTPLACGCEWISKYCDEHHHEINERAKRQRIERAHGERIAAAIRAMCDHVVAGHCWDCNEAALIALDPSGIVEEAESAT